MELAKSECGCTLVEGRLTISVTPVGSVNVANEDGTEDPAIAIVFGDSRTRMLVPS
jgi:hypothetical protein